MENSMPSLLSVLKYSPGMDTTPGSTGSPGCTILVRRSLSKFACKAGSNSFAREKLPVYIMQLVVLMHYLVWKTRHLSLDKVHEWNRQSKSCIGLGFLHVTRNENNRPCKYCLLTIWKKTNNHSFKKKKYWNIRTFLLLNGALQHRILYWILLTMEP